MEHNIISVDIGTTTIRAVLFDGKCTPIAIAKEQVTVDVASDDQWELRVEIDPDRLFEQFVRVVKRVLEEVPANNKVSLAICCQRNSFILWDKSTDVTLTKIICWNDTRSVKACEKWNNSFTIKGLNCVGAVLHFITRQPRFMAARVLHFISPLVTHRAMVTIEESGQMTSLLKSDQLGFGCLDTWLLHRLSCGRTTVSEASNCSATGMYDPYIGDYNNTILRLIGFPVSVLPPIVDSAVADGIATVDTRFFGREIKVVSVMADQQAALYGCGCWNKGDIKISLGTGAFVDMNTGQRPHASMNGLYPLVGWRTSGKDVFIAEGNDNNTATLLQWAQNIGLFEKVESTSRIAEDAGDTKGVVFVPAFNGLQTPINDVNACSGFLGIRPDTTREQMVRAILQSIAFRIHQIVDTMRDEINIKEVPRIRICGGVSSNEFVCQTIADLLDAPLERVADPSNSGCRGAALIAGLQLGIWQDTDISNFVGIERVFIPSSERRAVLLRTYQLWLKAVERCRDFYVR